MRRQLDELRAFVVRHGVPLFVAGDIFDRWNPPPELINFALRHLPPCYAIPGQHDLPYHAYADRHKSAYGTLVEAGVVTDLEGREGPHCVGGLLVHAFPWGRDLAPCPTPHLGALGTNVLMAHRYLWKKGHGYPGAPKDKNVNRLKDILGTYDACFFGDNHLAFRHENVVNCGGFYRRKSDEVGSRPSFWALMDDGEVVRHEMNVSADSWLEEKELARFDREARGVGKFLDALDADDNANVDYAESVERYMREHAVMPEVRAWVLKAMEE